MKRLSGAGFVLSTVPVVHGEFLVLDGAGSLDGCEPAAVVRALFSGGRGSIIPALMKA